MRPMAACGPRPTRAAARPRAQAVTWALAGKAARAAPPPGPLLARSAGGRSRPSDQIRRPSADLGATKTGAGRFTPKP